MNLRSSLRIVACCLGLTVTSRADAQGLEAIHALQKATVFIRVSTPDGESTGSGILLTTDGVVATAAHVLKGGTRARIRLSNGEELDVAGVLEFDPLLDLAIVRVPGFSLPTATLGNSDSVSVGERLIAIGAPLGLQGTVSDGLLSAVRIDEGTKRFQVSIPVSPGSSGGPVAVADGRIVGLVVSGIRGGGAENLNFVLPINYVRGRLPSAQTKQAVALSSVSTVTAERGDRDLRGTAIRSVNDSLPINWLALDGLEMTSENKLENNFRALGRVTYSVARRPNGNLQVERLSATRLRRKAAPLAPTIEVADDLNRTLMLLGDDNNITVEISRTPLAEGVAAGSSRSEIRDRTLKYAAPDGSTKRAEGLPRGIVPMALAGALIAAYSGDLPDSLDYWVANESNGDLVQAKWRRTGVATASVPVLSDGVSCVAPKAMRQTKVAVVVGVLSVGAQRTESRYRAEAPHFLVADDQKCVRIP